jgi:hypothetical protein
MRLVPDLVDACERLARCVQPLADAEGREYLVVRPHREGSADGYVPLLPWAVPLAEATSLELRHAAGRVVPGVSQEHVTPAVTVHRAVFGVGGRPRSRGVEPQTGRG